MVIVKTAPHVCVNSLIRCHEFRVCGCYALYLIGETFTAQSIIGSEFHGRIIDTTMVGSIPAIIPEITGRAWVTGTHQHVLDAGDPWPQGYRLSDTWPDIK